MKIALSTHLFVYRPFEDSLSAQIGQYGFRSIEIWCMYPHFAYREGDFIEQARKRLEQDGLAAQSVHLPFYLSVDRIQKGERISVIDHRPAARETALREAEFALHAAANLGAKIAVLHLGDLGVGINEQNQNLALDTIERLGDLAGKLAIELALENILSDFTSMQNLQMLVQQSGRTNIGVCLDVGHANVKGDPSKEAMFAGKLLRNTHIHDNDGSQDQHRPPGKGCVNWQKLFEVFAQNQYRGWHTLEIRDESKGEQSVAQLLQIAKTSVDRIQSIKI